jgi:hypothetical protein
LTSRTACDKKAAAARRLPSEVRVPLPGISFLTRWS